MARPSRPQVEIDKAVEAYAKGEQVETLMRRHKVSRAAIYQWINKAKDRAAEQARDSGKSPDQLARDRKVDASVALMQCQDELRRVKSALLDLMIQTGKI